MRQEGAGAGSRRGRDLRIWGFGDLGIWGFGLSMAPVTSLLPIKLHPPVKRFWFLGTAGADIRFQG